MFIRQINPVFLTVMIRLFRTNNDGGFFMSGTTEDFVIYSNELEEEIKVLVYLPPQYTPIQQYQYCIAQDGKDYFQLGRIARTLDELIENGEIEPILFFGIPYINIRDRRVKYHPEGAKRKNYSQFLIKELVPFLEQNYSVVTEPNGRGLAGDSLAATISLLTALDFPGSFGKVMLHSPYVDHHVRQAIDKFTNWNNLKIYHVVGKEETNVDMTDGNTANFLTINRELNEILSIKAVTYFYDEFHGNHTWKHWQKDLKRSLSYLFWDL